MSLMLIVILPEGIEFFTAIGTLSYGKTKKGGKLTPAALNVPITLILKC
jgi:hypothetical protein